MPSVCVDTNILIYAFTKAKTDEAHKNKLAQQAIKSAGTITLTPQILNELGFSLRRKYDWTDNELAALYQDLLNTCQLFIPSEKWHFKAIQLRQNYAISYWDSLIVAAALEAGCDTVLTEDLQHQQKIETLQIINPFV